MKTLPIVSIVVIGLSGVLAYNENGQRKLLSQQIDDYDRQNKQLLTQIENNSLRNIQTEEQLLSLQSELNNRTGQITALSRQLELAQQQIDPDYEQIEARIRQQLSHEMQASNTTLNTDPRTSVIKQLLNFDPRDTSELISLNASFGGFLKTLNISDERMNIVINALSNMIDDQNQARVAIAEEMRADPDAIDRSDIQQRMQAINQPEAQIEALSYDLTDSELNAFIEFQEQQRTNYNPFFVSGEGFITTTGSTPEYDFFRTERVESGTRQAPSVRLVPAQPSN